MRTASLIYRAVVVGIVLSAFGMPPIFGGVLIAGDAMQSAIAGNVLASDPLAFASTQNVFLNLKQLSERGYFLFGQEFPTDFQWATAEVLDHNPNDSDCKDVVGQHPGLFGSDFHYYLEDSAGSRIVHQRSVRTAHQRGALITFDWHLSSPEDRGGSFYVNDGNRELLADIVSGMDEKDECVGGPRDMCTWYFQQVDKVLEINRELGFTIVFRPLHEMTGFWFWWGNPRNMFSGNEDYSEFAHRYKKLYRSLVKYTRAKGAHNLLYVWSPSNEANFDFYPGDEWVDIVGLDIYEQGTSFGPSLESFKREMKKLSDFAEIHGKVAVVAETGFRMGYPELETRFWTEKVLDPILSFKGGLKIAWVMSWMNAQWERNPYIPFVNMQNLPAIEDFRKFHQAEITLFEGDFSGIETDNFKISGRVKGFNRSSHARNSGPVF